MKIYRKCDGKLQAYEYSGRSMADGRAAVAANTKGRGAILIDVNSIPPLRANQFVPTFGSHATPSFVG
ncbi:hypothetical protein HF313_15055 [Massilia atriviolacea]|uniref:Uncharacterized protein n=1 Tax=Massilia atriviolacea TaxID=2495579 RepID=A0A430HR72_9BURK|nr:hypothetical protein [Massilia atriviolacea]RSZ60030.1 hypothetical protein EJB06_07575 [Massilia atriviolacea]